MNTQSNNAILLADLHLHHLPPWRWDWCQEFVPKFLAKHGMEFQDNDLYILGDVIEIRDKVDSRVLNLLLTLISEWRAGDVVWLSGQHDSYLPGKATLHNLHGMKLERGQIFVVDDKPFEHKGNWFVPFQRRLEDYRNNLTQVPDDVIVLTHMPTKEIIEMYGAKDVDGISVKEFSRFKKTISGDIHKFYDFNELSYVGAPSQRDWRDKGVEGQIGVLKDGEFTRIPQAHPKHIEVTSNAEIPEDGEYIVRAQRGLNIDAENVLESVETSDIDIQGVKLVAEGSIDEKVDKYILENKPPFSKTYTKEYAMNLLEDSTE